MGDQLLSQITESSDLKNLSMDQLQQLATEMRSHLCQVLTHRPAHFASNLGVIELTLALHKVFDFPTDRLIWDTGHQIYPHKMVTGRAEQMESIRSKGGLMGYPNPEESDQDLFMTGHAGCSVSTMLGLRFGDDLNNDQHRRAVAVIGDGALPSGIVFEAFNNAENKDLIVILNDNQMSICPRVGGLAKTLDQARLSSLYKGAKKNVKGFLGLWPKLGEPIVRFLRGCKDLLKSNVYGGGLFEEMGFHYVGPINGHDLPTLVDFLNHVKERRGPVLLHVMTEKGHGVECALKDPVKFHTPPVFDGIKDGVVQFKKAAKSVAFTNLISEAVHKQMQADDKVCIMTAAMCQGNKLEAVRRDFPDRFFDTGICESHTVAFAAGLAKTGQKPIVSIYSTFLQRSFDQIFQEVSLQDLPVTFCLDRAGFTGPDGPTHHGNYDIPYMRMFPNMICMAPGDARDVEPMLEFALQQSSPVSMRYPKATPADIERDVVPIALGQAEVFEWGTDGCIIAIGSMFEEAVLAGQALREKGLDVGVINARFIKPLDTETILKALRELPFVITMEEGGIQGGFGSAVLEAAANAGVNSSHVTRLGVPDRYILHADRTEQLAECGLDANSVVEKALALAEKHQVETGKRVG